METEWEATFWPIDKNEIRARLTAAGAIQAYPERAMRRKNFFLPEGSELSHGWARVRDEGDKVTISLKQAGTLMSEQKETEVTVDSFDTAVQLLELLGCKEKAYQETTRELWTMNDVAITIDTWPFLEPLVEIEGASEEAVRDVALALGFSWEDAVFGAADVLYAKKYGIPMHQVNTEPRLVFTDPNPFEAKTRA